MGEVPTPDIDERFVVKPRFGPKIVRMLNADGHIDVAHKMGLVSLKTTLLDSSITEVGQVNEAKETYISRTRWATVLVTAKVKAPDGSIIECDGIACANDRDKFVKAPGFEVAVAETRAIKRALASACNITEKYISPKETEPSREFVDMQYTKDRDENNNEKPDLPEEVLRKPDIRPSIESIKQRAASGDQFDV